MNIKVIKSKRKTISLSVNDELEVVVKAPYLVSDKEIYGFAYKNIVWIDKAVENKKAYLKRVNISEAQVNRLIASAKDYIPNRVEYYSDLMKLKPSGIKITKAKKRFGSCNSKDSLCFSCYLMQFPADAVDYVIVHELAHTLHHNHSREFYKLIEQYMPDYKTRERLLKSV